MENNKHILSALNKTWILDLDGTILKHNGYKIDGKDTFLEGAFEFLVQIPPDDMIIFLTSRTKEYQKSTEAFLKQNNIRYNSIIFNVPYGERILINDAKPSGLPMTLAIDTIRDKFMDNTFEINLNL
ncbi:hypothetical protein AN396_04105 [Candidatus Epulonipiscium fishelsonii]|uniref:Uncharacterized protein n=1 Tax=Candidatus Epulonipiscium fishelsonii TaxID=77094 RepID=A0ACC8XDD7_9FIRM|nr:hypothetical protein AN396_04105 [Epulopiscium sp. SCG-B11WGA-EpuloA1]